MSFKVKNKKRNKDNSVVLDLEIGNEYLKKSMDKAYRSISRKAKMPGFRKGKVPYNIIDMNYGKSYVLNEAAGIAISELYPKIIEKSQIKPIDYPKIKINKIAENEPLDFAITVDVEPVVRVPRYKGIKVTGLSDDVYESDVENYLNKLRSNYATLENIDGDRPAQMGDFVTVDFEGKISGQDFEGNSAQDYSLEIGSKTLFEDFENALIGMKKGEKKNVSFVLPEDISNRALSGKKADFTIEMKDIKIKTLPDLDESFIKNFGDYDNIDEFKDYLHNVIKEQKSKSRRERIVADIVNNLVENSKFDVPESMVKNRIKFHNEEMEKRLNQNKISKNDFLRSYNITEEQYNQNLRKVSEREVKEYLIFISLEKAESENIEPSETQVEEEIKKIEESYDKKEDRDKFNNLVKTGEGKRQIINGIRRKNLVDLLVKNAKIIEEKNKEEEKPGSKKLWVPEQQEGKAGQRSDNKLWVPGTSKNEKESDNKK